MGYILTGDQQRTANKRIGEILRQFGQDEYPYNPEVALDALQAFSEGRFEAVGAASQPILRLISGGHNLVIDETDGSELISQACDVFPGWIDQDFINWGANDPSGPTPAMPVDVYELAVSAKFAQMFDSICAGPSRLCFAQSQIIGFVRKYPEWLHPSGWGTFFPFKSEGNFFVARVHSDDDGRLGAYVHKRKNRSIWDAEHRSRVVLPQL